jgi:uncharacterized protein YgbK (DUF1537 family)
MQSRETVSQVPVLALADDLTGALEIGAKFAGVGIQSVVTAAAPPRADRPVVVIDTQTRHLGAQEAYRRVRALAESARPGNLRLVYKKTDSTLRGNIGSELAALVDVFAGPLLYAPAYPEMGRTVRRGRLYVDGVPVSETAFARDLLNPIRESDISRAIGDWVLARSIDSTSLGSMREAGVYILDGESDEDLRAAARFLLASDGIRLAAGPAAFAGRLAERIDLPRAAAAGLPVVRTCLVVNGSLHEVSLGQARHAVDRGWPAPPPEGVAEAIRSSGWAILRAGEAATGEGVERARNLGVVVREILNRAPLDALVVFGGDTAAGIVHALRGPPIYPVREVVPGVALSRLPAAGLECLITKAGGFGAADILSRLRELLTKECCE